MKKINCDNCGKPTPVNELAYSNGFHKTTGEGVTHGHCSEKCFQEYCEKHKDDDKFTKQAVVEKDCLTIDQLIEKLNFIKLQHGGDIPVYYISDYDWVLPIGDAFLQEEAGNWDNEPDGWYVGLGN